MVCLRKLGPPTSYGLDEKKEKINLPLPSNDGNLRKGNLEIVEPGELVSSERLKMIKNNLKRNLKVFALSFPITNMSNDWPINIFSTTSNKISFPK